MQSATQLLPSVFQCIAGASLPTRELSYQSSPTSTYKLKNNFNHPIFCANDLNLKEFFDRNSTSNNFIEALKIVPVKADVLSSRFPLEMTATTTNSISIKYHGKLVMNFAGNPPKRVIIDKIFKTIAERSNLVSITQLTCDLLEWGSTTCSTDPKLGALVVRVWSCSAVREIGGLEVHPEK